MDKRFFNTEHTWLVQTFLLGESFPYGRKSLVVGALEGKSAHFRWGLAFPCESHPLPGFPDQA